MSKFCYKCGAPLNESARFCPKCGTQVAETTPRPVQNQEQQAAAPTSQSVKPNVAVVKKAANILLGGTTLAASPTAGEIAVGGFSPQPLSSVANILNPFKTVLSGVKRIFSSFKNISGNKKGLIAAIILAVVWIVLTLLPLLGVDFLPVKIASWLTFAQGGLKGGVLGFVGGVIGKGLFATLLISVLTGGKKAFAGIKSTPAKIKSTLKSDSLGLTLIGIGAALMLFNLMAGVSSPIQSMAGISGCLLSLKALSGGGFIRRLAISVTANKNGKTRTENTAKCTALLSGLSLGFAASAVISLIPWGYLPYCLGAAAIVAGVILGIVSGKKKEVPAQ